MVDYTELREILSQGNPEMLFSDGLDSAIIGVASRVGQPDVVAYCRDKCIEALIADGMDEEDAIEYFEYNIAGAYAGENTPIFINGIENFV